MSPHLTVMKHLLRGATLVGTLGLGIVACAPEYDRTELSATVADDLGGGISTRHLEVHEGMILKSHIVVWNDDNVQMPLAIRAVDSDIIEVANVISPRDFAFVGRRAGHTQIELSAGDVVVLTIEADVTAQPPLPAF